MLQITVERKKRGWSQAELARRAKLEKSVLSRLETGVMKPYPIWAKRLSDVLEVSEDILFREVNSYGNPTTDSN